MVAVGRRRGVQMRDVLLPASLAGTRLQGEGEPVVVDPEDLVADQDGGVLEQVAALETPANREGRLDGRGVEVSRALGIEAVHRPVGEAADGCRRGRGDRARLRTGLVTRALQRVVGDRGPRYDDRRDAGGDADRRPPVVRPEAFPAVPDVLPELLDRRAW